MTNLENKTALVTGASRGIGKAIALRFAQAGANVACVSRSAASVADTVAAITALGRKAKGYAVDVADTAAVESVAKQIETDFEAVHFLINNAGITKDTLLARMTSEDWDTVLDTNLKGAFNWTKPIGRAMVRQREGRIVNISSIVGLMGNPGQANYAASKAGLIGFTKSIAREFASRGITVCPGFIATDMTHGLSDELKTRLLQNIPLQRLGTPEDIAGITVFLCSAEATYITGQTLTVDGGMVM
jgi:3-oxoacyl-[acyl-carrier protein] reductase